MRPFFLYVFCVPNWWHTLRQLVADFNGRYFCCVIKELHKTFTTNGDKNLEKKMKFILGLAIMLSTVAASAYAGVYFDSKDLDISHTNIRFYDVQFVVAPTKTEVRRIPGCEFYGRPNHEICNETVVLETAPTVQITASYKDGIFPSYDRRNSKVYFILSLDPASFSEAAVAELKTLSKSHAARVAWAEQNFDFQTNVVSRSVQIVDVANSKLCTTIQGNRWPERIPGCVEVLNYKTVQRTMTEVKAIVK